MALSQIIKNTCPKCGKVAIEKSRLNFGQFRIINLECGHSHKEDELGKVNGEAYEFLTKNNMKLRPYQIEGLKFIEKSNARCLIADEMGLGKTVQASGALRLHPELFPAVVATKTTIKNQWWYELGEWVGEEFLVQVLNTSKEIAIPGFHLYVTTYDMLKNENMFDLVELKTIIIDECQVIKNHTTGRAKAVQKIAKRCEHIIALSGTPIKNNASEYFTILNILRPQKYTFFDKFVREYCDHYETMYGFKVGGLKNPDLFHDETKDFIIRRTREEAAPDLPRINRIFHHVELDKKLNDAYRSAMKELDDLLYSDEDENTWAAAITIMTKMRKITGISKAAMEAVDYTMDFLDSNDKKIVIFRHHNSANTLLSKNLNIEIEKYNKEKKDTLGFKPINPVLELNSELNGFKRADVVAKFKDDPQCRVMLASTLAAGEGLNLQFCSDAIMLERQWNPANEEQAEGRFSRIGSTANQVNVIYFIASGTIDEYFTELVEQKRAIIASTLDNKEIAWEETNLMRELAGILLSRGKERWRL